MKSVPIFVLILGSAISSTVTFNKSSSSGTLEFFCSQLALFFAADLLGVIQKVSEHFTAFGGVSLSKGYFLIFKPSILICIKGEVPKILNIIPYID